MRASVASPPFREGSTPEHVLGMLLGLTLDTGLPCLTAFVVVHLINAYSMLNFHRFE
jgi:hypothetical protein